MFLFFLLCAAPTPASSQLWLNYSTVSASFRAALSLTSLSCALPGPICGELHAGLTSLGFLSGSGGGRALSVVLSPAGAPTAPAWPPSPTLEGYSISIGAEDRALFLESSSLQGALYGAWRLLALVQREAPSLLAPGVAEASTPSSPLRMWDLWDNLDGSVERGYAGRSVLYPLGSADPKRVADLARLLSSMGLNAIVLNNVNACGNGNQALLSSPNVKLLAPLAAAFYAYGLHSVLVPCWSSPETVGGLNTSDPRSAAVSAWWAAKIAEVRGAFPPGAFRGLLFKGDTEGQPGPGVYNLTELFGANYFGALLGKAEDAIVIWRAFSHPPGGRDMPLDQALFQFNRFKDWDGATLPNVALQTKNGPFDFQVREPVHSLFGALPRTNLILEVEATPEYLGQDVHAIALPLQWATYLSFDLCGGCAVRGGASGGGGDSTLGGVVSRGAFSGMAAVSNFGAQAGWTGHALNAGNALGFGRLAWAPRSPPLGVVQEWAELTFPGSAPQAIAGLVGLLGDTWGAYENFTASLGWGFAAGGNHYSMDPADRKDYTNATASSVGYSRGVGGYAATYQGQARADFSSLDACPEELLLAFWTVPYSHVLRGARFGGLTVLQWIYSSHAAGAAASAGFVERWGALTASGGLKGDPGVLADVAARLTQAARDAADFSQTIVGFFSNLTKVPPPG
jgi:alpha-glucuronidase